MPLVKVAAPLLSVNQIDSAGKDFVFCLVAGCEVVDFEVKTSNLPENKRWIFAGLAGPLALASTSELGDQPDKTELGGIFNHFGSSTNFRAPVTCMPEVDSPVKSEEGVLIIGFAN